MNILMQLSTGIYADFDNLAALDVRLEDVAHHLSMRVRFGGACNAFYSVAQHARRVAELVALYEPEHELDALHHDDTEYLIGDMVKPMKVKDEYFTAFEDELHRTKIVPAFGLSPAMPKIVKWADTVLLVREMQDLLPHGIAGYDFPADMIEAADVRVRYEPPMDWYSAKMAFLEAHRQIVNR